MTATLTAPGRIDVIATGRVEWDKRGRPKRDNRLRHEGIVYPPGQRLQMEPTVARKHARAGTAQIVADLPTVDWWNAPGRVLMSEPGEAVPFPEASGALRIAQGTSYDPGGAAYRFHSAIGEYGPHVSAFVRYLTSRNNPYQCPTQYNANKAPALVRSLLMSADVVHTHMDSAFTMAVGMAVRSRKGQTVVRHYHGTQFNGAGQQEADDDQIPRLRATQDDIEGYVLVGARLTICALRPGRIQWLPITVPVDRYAAMVRPREPGGPFRIAHSPTSGRIKGTQAFRDVCARLRKRGLAIEPVLIEKRTHAQALAIKTTCDATFDAFNLGIQGSGLEAAAMGQPVIAGDAKVAALYQEHVGEVPYTFAGDEGALERAIERLATDPAHYMSEAARVHAYCRRVHDYSAVAARYARILTDAGARRLD